MYFTGNDGYQILPIYNPTNSFTVTGCLFGTVKLLRNRIISKFTYNVRGIDNLMDKIHRVSVMTFIEML